MNSIPVITVKILDSICNLSHVFFSIENCEIYDCTMATNDITVSKLVNVLKFTRPELKLYEVKITREKIGL
jgi:hypothetical protein